MTIIEKYAEQREQNKDKKLLFLGTATSCFDVDYDNYDEVWAMSGAFGKFFDDVPKIDLGFEIHPMDQMIKIADERKVDYNKYDCPVFVQDENCNIAKALMDKPKTFPLEDVIQYAKEVGASKCFTDTYCYMLVYASMMGYKHITFFRILLTSDLEYYLERSGVEYWMDYLGHRENINFLFPEDAEMWTEDVLYGYEQRPHLWKLESRKKYLFEVFQHHFYDCEAINANLNRCGGILEMFHLLKNLKENKIKEEDINKIVEECRQTIERDSVKFQKSREMYFQFSGAIQTISFNEMRGY